MRSEWLVYWLFDETCVCYERHGCIGAMKATRLYQRFAQHQNSKRFPKDFGYKIIFRGSRRQALALEARLRPRPYIGWNVGVGGFADGGGLKGIPKPPEQIAKMAEARRQWWAKQTAKDRAAYSAKMSKAIDNRGKRNPNFGKQQSEATKAKVRAKIIERGGVNGANNPNYRHGRYVTPDDTL
jgi:NUMOD3 motif